MNIILFVDGEDRGVMEHLLRDHFKNRVEVRRASEILGEFRGSVGFTPDLFFLLADTMNTLTQVQMVRVLVQTGIPVVVLTIRTDVAPYLNAGARKALSRATSPGLKELGELIG